MLFFRWLSAADHPEFCRLVVLDDAHTSKPELTTADSSQTNFFPVAKGGPAI